MKWNLYIAKNDDGDLLKIKTEVSTDEKDRVVAELEELGEKVFRIRVFRKLK